MPGLPGEATDPRAGGGKIPENLQPPVTPESQKGSASRKHVPEAGPTTGRAKTGAVSAMKQTARDSDPKHKVNIQGAALM